MKKYALLALAIVAMLSACSEKVTNNHYYAGAGAIRGRIEPIDAGTVVSVKSGEFSTVVDNHGDFYLDQLPIGVYHVVVQPTSHSRRELTGVLVNGGQIVDLGEIALSNYPYPIYRIAPADGEILSRSIYYLDIFTDEALNLGDLDTGVTITPECPGAWVERAYLRGYYYRFYPAGDRSGFGSGRTYQVTLAATIRTTSGAPLGTDISISFETDPLRVSVRLPSEGASGGIPLAEFQPSLQFGEEVHVDSVNRAVRFDPALDGTWLIQTRSGETNETMNRVFYFFPAEPYLSPQTAYALIISNQVYLNDDQLHLLYPDTTVFTTEPLGVTSVYPAYGRYAQTGTTIRLFFNTDMDTASVEAAFTVVGDDSGQVQGVFAWENKQRMIFYPASDLEYGIYRITLSAQARQATGEYLTTDFSSYFLAAY